MGFLKSKWRLLTFIAVCLASMGGGALAYMAGDEVTDNLKKLDDIRRNVEGVKSARTNMRTIEERKKAVERYNADFEKSLNSALAMQKNNAFESAIDADGKAPLAPRTLLLDKCLPKPTKAAAINFKKKYAEKLDELKGRLHGRDKPTTAERSRWIGVLQATQSKVSVDLGPWGPSEPGETKTAKKEASLSQLLREHAAARAADEIARGIYMYLPESAIGKQAKALTLDVPTDVDIWHAQMSLWIQQDIVDVLARLNEERIAKLKSDGRAGDCWVAYLPVKHLIALRIDAKLGRGGGSNVAKNWPVSFTTINNEDKMFKVPLQVEVVVEEAVLMELMDRFCKQGFYTPINLGYESVKPNPLMEDYIYGEEPVIKAVIDLEAYYFRSVFEEWIPPVLKKALKTPNAVDDGKP